MNVTVCVTTRNRPDELVECLRSVAASSVPVHETIVSDDSTNESTRSLVRTQFPGVIYVEGPRRGLCANRNAAISASSGNWVLLLDDDARLGVDFIAKVMPALHRRKDQRVIFTGIEQQTAGPVYPKAQNFLGFQRKPYRPQQPMNTLVINATLFPADLVKRLKFDERLIYGYDEVDIAARARAAGWQIILCPDAVNFHFPSQINRDYYKPHTEPSRIYVTYKKYLAVQRKPIKATLFLCVSFLHSLAYHSKHDGVRGSLHALAAHRNAWHMIALWRRDEATAK